MKGKVNERESACLFMCESMCVGSCVHLFVMTRRRMRITEAVMSVAVCVVALSGCD